MTTHPKYENTTEMLNAAAGEDDNEVNMRLVALDQPNNWLRCNANGNFWHDMGRRVIPLTREAAQNLIDIEWGRKS